MPTRVDHETRRAQIADALVRVAARDGLHAATMRAVAEEAGVSLRLVQYYFATKGGLLRGALEHLERESHARWAARLREHFAPARERIEAFCAEALPDDEPSRAFHGAFMAYAALASTDPALAAEPFVAGPDRLERLLAELLAEAAEAGELAERVDPALEAARLLSLVHGVGDSVLLGQREAVAAREVLRYHLDRVFR